MDVSSRQKINKETQALNDTLDQMNFIFIEHSIQKQLTTHSSQVHTEHSAGLAACQATRWALVNLRKLKSYQASFLTTMLRDYISITGKTMYKDVEIKKKYVSK